jgi:hypothetical protein
MILMSQNRQAVRDRFDAQQDYQVNLKAEIEVMGFVLFDWSGGSICWNGPSRRREVIDVGSRSHACVPTDRASFAIGPTVPEPRREMCD